MTADTDSEPSAADDRREQIEARLTKATPGPWRLSQKTPVVVVIPRGGANGHDWKFDSGDRLGYERNADLIAHAPSDLAYLLSALTSSEEQRDAAREALREIGNGAFSRGWRWVVGVASDALAATEALKEGDDG